MTTLAPTYSQWDGTDDTMMPNFVEFEARFATSDLTNSDPAAVIIDSFWIMIRSNGKTSADFCAFENIIVESNQTYPIYYFISDEEGRYHE
jgi:hypothetical protein